MKNVVHVGAREHSGTVPAVPARATSTTATAAQLQRALSDLADVTHALATSRDSAQAAWQHIQTLTAINSRLNRGLLELAVREAQVREFAYHDELTGLPNRRLLSDRLKQAVAQAARRHNQVALLLLDLDGFKSVNDSLGHAGGDKLLQAVGKRLAAGIRGADTVCRYGGDEFVVMLPEVDNPGMAAAVWGKLKLALGEPYIIDGYRVRLTTSMGGAFYPTDGQTDEELLRRADGALYRAKARSANASIEALPGRVCGEADSSGLASFQQPGLWRDDELELR